MRQSLQVTQHQQKDPYDKDIRHSTAGGSGRGIAARQVGFRTSAGMAIAALTMLSDERTAQNNKRRYMTSRGMKHKTAI